MAGPLSNPTPSNSKSAYPGTVPGKVRRGGTTKRPGIPVADGPAKARAVTMSGVGTEGGTPESGRARQDAARGTVHGQPRSGFKSRGTEAIPNRGS
jgi:hypothetical protein